MQTQLLTPVAATPTLAQASAVATAAPGTLPRRRPRAAHAVDAVQGASLVTQQLPFAARASVSVSGRLLYPVLGAALGALLLGVPGALVGGIAGFLLSR